ncbi:hypothetical protein MD484_g777, partial [Candolleomyces efflorescens]
MNTNNTNIDTTTGMHPLALRYGKYILATELSIDQVRDLPNFREIYDKVNAEWIASGPKRPTFATNGLDEKLALEQFYEEIDGICFEEGERTPEQMERIYNPEAHPEIPGLRAKFHVEPIPTADETLDRIVESLLDKPFTYRRPDGTPAECTIVDFGTSRRFASGKYYVVSHGDDEVMYTEDDVKSILENRVE